MSLTAAPAPALVLRMRAPHDPRPTPAGADDDPDPAARRARRAAPRRTLGVFADGRTGPRLAAAAAALGVDLRFLPVPADGADAAARTRDDAARCDVVTATAEHVPAAALAAVEPVAAARPHAALHAVAQDRVREKSWLDARAGHAAPWHLADSPHALAAAARALGERLDAERGADGARGAARADVLGARYVAKPRHRRPGGPAPAFLATPDDAWAAWRALGGRPCVIEPALAIDTELTVLVARTGRGHAVVYPAAQTARDGARRRWSVCPAPVPTPVARKAQALGAFYANRLGVEGLLAVELFVLADGRVVVNELVPCPHPALDAAELACATDQYAQLVRAVCGLPLGDVALVAGAAATVPLPLACAPAARGPDLLDLIADARLTWYGEAPGGADAAACAAGGAGAIGGAHGRARDDAHRDAHQGAPGGARRGAAEPLAGHVTATGRTPDDAVERALAAAEWVHAAARHARRRCAAGGP